MSTSVRTSAADSRESGATARPSRRVSYKESLLPARLDSLIARAFYCPDPPLVPRVRLLDPGAPRFTDWSDFAVAFPQADVNVVLCDAPGADDLAARLGGLARKHSLPSVIVVTHLDVEHVLPFRRASVDQFVALSSMAGDLPLALLRGVIDHLREHLALHVERLDSGGPQLRLALAHVLRRPSRAKTIRRLAAAEAVTPRTLENQWKALSGGADRMRLLDLLWTIRLIEVLELRARGTPLAGICQDLQLDLRSLQRACRRHLGKSLGRVSAAAAIAELLRLRRRILERLGGVETRRG
jgi:hypothetical protein